VLPAAVDGKPSKLIVEDAFQPTYFGEDSGWRFDVIGADGIAKNLIGHFRSGRVGMIGDLGPGIFMVDPNKDLKEQIVQAQAIQDEYFDSLYRQGEYYADNNQYEHITDDHRLAAKWLKLKPGWISRYSRDATIDCPLCGTPIPQNVFVCPNCNRAIKKIPDQYKDLK